MPSRRASHLIFLAAFCALTPLLHLPWLKLPFHWDELGQFVPAALDFYRDGAWVAHSTTPNVHPPGLSAILAAVWGVTGFSIVSTRLAMLAIAAAGLYLSFLLAIRLSRVAWGAPAFPAVLFLIAAPLFQTQSMLVLLDMPAMTFTMAALLLFFHERWAWCAVACTALVLIKETAVTTPMVLAAWLWLRDGRRREALYFLAPAAALAIWLLMLRGATGSWFGNAAFMRSNLTESVVPTHILYAVARRIYFLFVADGHWIGAIALYFGWRTLRGRDWGVAGAVALAQLSIVTVFGGAVLERYLLPVLPILYAAVAVAATVYSRRVRLASHAAMLLLLAAGWIWNPPYPFPLENNLRMVDFVRLQQAGAEYLELYARDARIAAAWPFNNAIRDADMGYLERPLNVARMGGQRASDFAQLGRSEIDIAVVFSHGRTPSDFLRSLPGLRGALQRFIEPSPYATPEEMQRLGFVSLVRWSHGGEWMQIYGVSPALGR